MQDDKSGAGYGSNPEEDKFGGKQAKDFARDSGGDGGKDGGGKAEYEESDAGDYGKPGADDGGKGDYGDKQ